MEEEDIFHLMANYLAGTTSEEEAIVFETWMNASPQNRKYFVQVKNIWEASDKRFNPAKISKEKALNLVMDRISKESKGITLWKTWQKIAAILIIPLLIASLFWNKEVKIKENISYNEVFASYGTRSSIKLADGSTVWLNSGSTLKYPDKFISETRVVYLTGEAYFEVKSDASHAFIVETPSISVKATGTKFNVMAYTNDDQAEVTLVSGKVSVSTTSDSSQTLLGQLKANENLVYNTSSHQSLVKETETYKYIAWKDGKLIFRNEPMVDVLRKIGLLYNVQFELHGKELKEYRYRATFENETLDEILKILKSTSPIDYVQVKRSTSSDGTISRQKVIISMKKQ
jgi:transmembrane sensor